MYRCMVWKPRDQDQEVGSRSKIKKDPIMHKDEIKDKVVGKRGESTHRMWTEIKIIQSRKE